MSAWASYVVMQAPIIDVGGRWFSFSAECELQPETGRRGPRWIPRTDSTLGEGRGARRGCAGMKGGRSWSIVKRRPDSRRRSRSVMKISAIQRSSAMASPPLYRCRGGNGTAGVNPALRVSPTQGGTGPAAPLYMTSEEAELPHQVADFLFLRFKERAEILARGSRCSPIRCARAPLPMPSVS